MLTQEDIQKLLNVFVTKPEFQQEMDKLREDLTTKEDFRQFMDKMDEIYGEVKDFRQEQAVKSVHQEETEQEVSALKRRVGMIESIPVIAHEIKATK